MHAWLNGPGKAFLQPLPGSTNYLGAYRHGVLLRAREAAQRGKNLEEGDNLPKETLRDLRPFPLNDGFVSQPVLSEELREDVWYKVMRQGKSIKVVSALLGIEMSRVAAVVRLKEVEKMWEREVCLAFFFFGCHFLFRILAMHHI
jgi:hypothetical protein